MAYDLIFKTSTGRNWSRQSSSDLPYPLLAKLAVALGLGTIVTTTIFHFASRGPRPPVSGPPTMFARPAPGGYKINPRAARAYFARR